MGRKPSETLRFFTTTLIGVIFGFLVGVSISIFYVSKINPANYIPETLLPTVNQTLTNSSKTWISSDPRGAERLPPGIVASESDYFLRRLWGEPSQDVPKKPKYLVTFTVGYDQRKNIEASI